MDQIEALEKAERGRRAAELLESPLWKETWAGVHDEIVAAWMRTTEAQVEQREALYFETQALLRLRAKLGMRVSEGHVAQAFLDEGTVDGG